MKTNVDILKHIGKKLISSIDLISNGYFLLSETNKILEYKVKDETLNIILGNRNLQGQDFFHLISPFIVSEELDQFNHALLEREAQIIEIGLKKNGKISYYELTILILENNQILTIFRNIDEKKDIKKKLIKEEQFLNNLIELNPYAIVIYDKDGQYLRSNKAHFEMHGTIPTPQYSFFNDPNAQSQPWFDEFVQTIRNGETYYAPDMWYNAHLAEEQAPDILVCIRTVIFPIKNSTGNVENYVFIYEDITERKLGEQKLKDSEENFRNLADLLPEIIYEVDLDLNLTYVNTVGFKITGYTREDFEKGIKVTKFLAPEELQRAFESIKKVFKGELTKANEYIMLKKDGTRFHARIHSRPKYRDNKIVGLRGLIVDITDTKLSEKKLKESELKYRHLFNSTPYAIWLVNLRGIIVDCNETMNNFMSIFKNTDLIGKSFREVIQMFFSEGDPRFDNLAHVFRERFKKLLKQGYLEPIEFEIFRGDGKTFWITLETSFVEISEEKLIQVFIKDITERKLAEQKLDELRKELENRVKERTIKLESSESKYRTAYNRVNCFKGLFTHDISNMVQTISNSIEQCQNQLKQGMNVYELIKDFDLIEQQLTWGKKLISNIRNLSEIEDSEMPIEPVEVFENLNNAINFIKVNFQNRNINVNINSEEEPMYVLANELLLDVFENLMMNSVRYNDKMNVKIEVKISRIIDNNAEYIRIEFKDNGIGIEDSYKEIIFQKGYKKRFEAKGMGLGLSLVAKLIELCIGKIWVEDRIEGDHTQGSNFIILIPEAKEL